MGSVLLHDVPVLRHVRAQLLHLLVGRAVPGCDLGPQVVHVLARDHSASGPPRGPHDGQDDGGGCDPQVCRFCRSMPCARLFSLLRETPPEPSWRGKRGQQVRRWLERRGRRAVRPRTAGTGRPAATPPRPLRFDRLRERPGGIRGPWVLCGESSSRGILFHVLVGGEHPRTLLRDPDRQPRHRRREELRPVRGVLPARRAVGTGPRSVLGANGVGCGSSS